MGGISTEEINTLELETLNRIDWRLFVSPDDFEHTMNFILPASQSQISSARTAAAAAEVPATASSAKEQAAQAQPEPAPRCCSPRECSSARSAQASPEPDCPVADVGPTTPTNSETPRRNEKLPLPGKRRRSSTRASGERKQVRDGRKNLTHHAGPRGPAATPPLRPLTPAAKNQDFFVVGWGLGSRRAPVLSTPAAARPRARRRCATSAAAPSAQPRPIIPRRPRKLTLPPNPPPAP